MDDESDIASKAGKIKVVGPCKSGKSTLVTGLQRLGYHAQSCSQEHSDVPAMWQRINPADVLVYLDVTVDAMEARGPRGDWHTILPRQHRRLAHAREHCDIYIQTATLSPDQILERVMEALSS